MARRDRQTQDVGARAGVARGDLRGQRGHDRAEHRLGADDGRIAVLFCTHSIPTTDAEASENPRARSAKLRAARLRGAQEGPRAPKYARDVDVDKDADIDGPASS